MHGAPWGTPYCPIVIGSRPSYVCMLGLGWRGGVFSLKEAVRWAQVSFSTSAPFWSR